MSALSGQGSGKRNHLNGGIFRVEEYIYNVEWQEERQRFAAQCPGYPSLNWYAETEEKAIEGLKHIISAIENQFITYFYAQ